jgi:hypothetical protein
VAAVPQRGASDGEGDAVTLSSESSWGSGCVRACKSALLGVDFCMIFA